MFFLPRSPTPPCDVFLVSIFQSRKNLSISEIREFMKRLPQLQEEHLSLGYRLCTSLFCIRIRIRALPLSIYVHMQDVFCVCVFVLLCAPHPEISFVYHFVFLAFAVAVTLSLCVLVFSSLCT